MKKSGPEWGWLDALLLLLLAGAGAWLAYRAAVELEYHWHWEAIPQYLLRRGDQGWAAGSLTQGLWCTLRLSFWAALLALPLGLAAALARLGRLLYLRLLARTLIELLRNLPPLVLLFLGYYFLADPFAALLADDWPRWAKAHPSLAHLAARLWAPPAELAPFLAALMTLALLEGAYVAEILRAGIQSIHQGQWDACQTLGLGRWQAYRHVILPQALRRVLPPLAGQMVSLVKDSAMVSVLAIQDLTWQGSQIMASTYLSFEVWLTVAALYLVLTLPCSCLSEYLYRRLNRRLC